MGQYQKHHYIPKSLLRMFTFQNDSIWQFSKTKTKIEQKNIKNVAYVKNFYKAEETDDPLFFEREVGKIEDAAISIIKTLSDKYYKISQEEKEILAIYLTVLELRTPTARDSFSTMADILIRPLFLENLKHKKDTDPKMIEYVEKATKIELNTNGHLGNIGNLLKEEFFKYYLMKHWTFATCEKGTSFIIGDNPSILYSHPTNPMKNGIAQEGSFKYFPLRKDLAVFMDDPVNVSTSFVKLTKNEVRALNIDILSRSKEYCYGCSDKQLEYLSQKANLKSYALEDTYRCDTLKTNKPNEEILWLHNPDCVYLEPQIRLKLENQRYSDLII